MTERPHTTDRHGNVVHIGDVVQVDIQSGDAFAGCLVVVEEIKSFGVQGYALIPDRDGPKLAYYRATTKQIAHVGTATWMQP